jgi:putative DNA primase/helicase
MSSSIVEAGDTQNAENPVAVRVLDVELQPEETPQFENVVLVDDPNPALQAFDPEQPADGAAEIEMVPAVSENGVVYQASFASGGWNRSWAKQVFSQWGWNLKPFTDVANAERFVERCGGNLHYCAAWKKWLVWDGRRWEIDRIGEVNEKAKAVLREMRKMPRELGDMKKMIRFDFDEYGKHVRRSEGKYKLSAMIELAQTVPPIPVTAEQLDANPWLLNCLNGTIDLRTGEPRNHRREDLLTKLIRVEYDPDAKCPTFDAFLARIMNCNAALIDYLQRIVGYCLTGDVGEKAMFVLYGDGNNGKTTFLEAIRNVLADYAGQVPIQSLMKRKWDEGIPNDIAQLQGKRFVTSSETEAGKELNVAKVKHLTGLATLQARYLYAEYTEFTPTFKLFLDSNHKPIIPADDPAIWNRLKFIPFTVTIPDADIDRQMAAKLRAEDAGILAWAVRGCLEWRRRGLGEPDEVKAATQSHRREMDTIGRFIEERCEVGPNFRETTTRLYCAYRAWCDQTAEQRESPKAFGMALERIPGLLPGRNNKVGRYWDGVRLQIPNDATQSKVAHDA